MPTVTVYITHAGKTYTDTLDTQEPLRVLLQHIHEHTGIPQGFQKVLLRRKMLNKLDTNVSLLDAGIAEGDKINVIGSRPAEVAGITEALERVQARHSAVSRRKTARPTPTHRPMSEPRFLSISEHSESEAWPHRQRRREVLERLASDPAVVDLMQRRNYTVGQLNDNLHPVLDPTILGLNVNAGHSISLRLLTQDLSSLITYSSVRRVLMHELAHNVHSEHDNSFKELDSAHVKDITAFERARSQDGHRIGGEITVAVHEPETEHALDHGGCVVGDASSLGHRIALAESYSSEDAYQQDHMREQLAQAAEKRQRKAKEER